MITDQDIEKCMVTMKIIWFAILISLVIYLFIGILVGPSMQSSINKDLFRIFRMAIYAVAFVTLIITRFIRRLILSPKPQINASSQDSQQPALQRYQSAMIVALALSESIGVYGLVLFFLGKNYNDLYLLIIISAVAMVMYRPNKDDVIRMIRESNGIGPGPC